MNLPARPRLLTDLPDLAVCRVEARHREAFSLPHSRPCYAVMAAYGQDVRATEATVQCGSSIPGFCEPDAAFKSDALPFDVESMSFRSLQTIILKHGERFPTVNPSRVDRCRDHRACKNDRPLCGSEELIRNSAVYDGSQLRTTQVPTRLYTRVQLITKPINASIPKPPMATSIHTLQFRPVLSPSLAFALRRTPEPKYFSGALPAGPTYISALVSSVPSRKKRNPVDDSRQSAPAVAPRRGDESVRMLESV